MSLYYTAQPLKNYRESATIAKTLVVGSFACDCYIAGSPSSRQRLFISATNHPSLSATDAEGILSFRILSYREPASGFTSWGGFCLAHPDV